MHFITSALAVGSLADAGNADLRRRRGIDAVLSLLDVDFNAGEHHATIAVADRAELPSTSLRAATGFIDRHLRAGRKVLVHCQMGISRSPAIAAGYLHEHAGVGLPDALTKVCTARPQAAPHPLLVDSLYREYAPASPAEADLSANENPFGPSPQVAAALQAVLGRSHRYPDRHGSALREALAGRLGVGRDAIVLGNGSCEILDLVARSTLTPGDEAIIAAPSFLPYRSAIQRSHGKVVAVPLRADFCHDLSAMAAQVNERTRLVFIGHPNNPTGTAVGRDELDAFLDALPASVTVLVDEAYGEYLNAADAADAIACVRAGRPVIAVRTFSKIHGLAGLRIGYAVAAPATAAGLERWRPHYNTSAAAQAAALAALADEGHVRRSRDLNAQGLKTLSEGARRLGLDVLPSQANFVLVRCGDAERVANRLHALGVRVKSGTPFGLPEHLRISVGSPADNARCLAALPLALAANPIDPTTGASAW